MEERNWVGKGSDSCGGRTVQAEGTYQSQLYRMKRAAQGRSRTLPRSSDELQLTFFLFEYCRKRYGSCSITISRHLRVVHQIWVKHV